MSCLHFEKEIKLLKSNDSLNDNKYKKRRVTLSCSKKISELLHKITSKNKGHSYF